jgi:EAL domain-containing protein (putative c-di-GMP-specific phosphodiesterase class I)/CHASE2 domain-containing sensor protein/GGDEF domain-containing protein
MPSTRDWSSRRSSLGLALLVALSAGVFSAAGLFDPVEDALTTQRAEALTRAPTEEIAIVELDARSLAELRSWPWPRTYHAQVVRELHQAGASIIAFDIDFSARSGSGDEELAAAIADAGHVILPIFEQKWSSRQDNRPVLASRPDVSFDNAWVGGVNIFPDSDGVVREYPAATFIGGAVQPSIATLLAEKDELGDRTFQPDWSIDIDRIPRYSFVQVMKGQVPARELRGKRILIGATAVELGDRYAVPRYGVVPGVMVQALAAESLLQGRAIQRTSLPVTIIGILLIALALAPRPVRSPIRYGTWWGCLVISILATPVIVERLWPISIESAAWLFTALIAAALQAGVEARRRLRFREETDAESGLPNRSVLETALGDRTENSPVLVAAAIERFENIRDGIGLAATNEMIRSAASLIGKQMGGSVYRIAPDVLAWLLPDEDDATTQASLKCVQSVFREPVVTQAGPVDVTFTLGLASEKDRLVPVLLIEHALSAITTARSTGKSNEWYSGSDPQLRRQLSMMSDLRAGMDKGRLSLAYQPKLSLASDSICDAEALIRWRDADGNNVSPDEFIPLAEATGVICEVTIFALRTAAADLARWAREGVTIRVAVNVSAMDLATPDFANHVLAILHEFNVPPSQLALEVTESSLIRSPAEAISTLMTLRERGIRLSVDDYGTGQSTLSYLKHLPVHEVKIDKSFVTMLANSESDAIMVRSTINLAHDLGLQVVAEGIEDSTTLKMLREFGCDYAQGYFISKPVKSHELLALVADQGKLHRVA